MSSRPKKAVGKLIAIGGHEDRHGDRVILREVVRHALEGTGRLVIIPAASDVPERYANEYEQVFRDLGVKHVDVVDVRTRKDGDDPSRIRVVEQADVAFITGGDQLRLASQLGGTPLYESLLECHRRGATIAGTSAGAAAMPETILVAGPGDVSHEADALDMAPGLALIHGVVIDTHFAERGRFGRLVGAVVRNPRNVGIGLDEDTAIVVEAQRWLRVLGSGAVYVLDGTHLTYSSLEERRARGLVSVHGLRVHVLGGGQRFDLACHQPLPPEEDGRRAEAQ